MTNANLSKVFLATLGVILAAQANATTPPASAAAALPAKKMTVESGKVEFLAVGKPSFLKVNGTGSAPTGNLTLEDGKASGEFSFELGTLDTKNETRTEHMKNKYLEVEKFPKATIKFKDIAATGEKVQTAIPAELTLHGQTHPVTLTAELSGTNKKTASGTFKIKLSEFGIAVPTYAGVTIADEVTVTIDSVLK